MVLTRVKECHGRLLVLLPIFLSDKIIELYEVLEDMRVKHAQKLQSNAYRSFKVT